MESCLRIGHEHNPICSMVLVYLPIYLHDWMILFGHFFCKYSSTMEDMEMECSKNHRKECIIRVMFALISATE